MARKPTKKRAMRPKGGSQGIQETVPFDEALRRLVSTPPKPKKNLSKDNLKGDKD